MLEDSKAMCPIKADKIKPRRLAALGRIDEPSAQVADIVLVHCAGLHRIVGEGADRQGRGRKGDFLGIKVRPVDPRIGKLDARQRAVGLHLLGHAGDRRDILILPKAQFDERRDLG